MVLREVFTAIVILMDEYNNEETTDERRLQIESEMDAIDISIEEKSDSIADLINHYAANAEQLKKEEQRLNLWRKREERSAEWLENYLSSALLSLKKTKFETDFHKFSFRKSEALKVENTELIPDKFFIPVPATTKLDN